MSEGKTIIDISKELTDKNFTFSDYFIEVDTADETYKMSFETYFEGVLAPDGSGNIDIGNNNLINITNISGLNMNIAGSLTVVGSEKNSVNHFISFKIDDGSGSEGNTITNIDNNGMTAWATTTNLPDANVNSDFFEIAGAKCSQLFKMMYDGLYVTTAPILRFYRYDRVLETYNLTGMQTLTLVNDTTANEIVIREIFKISEYLTADEDVRVFIQNTTFTMGVELCTIWALQ